MLYDRRSQNCKFLLITTLTIDIFLKWPIPGLFFLYFRLFNTVYNEYMNKSSPMTRFEPRTSDVGSDYSTN